MKRTLAELLEALAGAESDEQRTEILTSSVDGHDDLSALRNEVIDAYGAIENPNGSDESASAVAQLASVADAIAARATRETKRAEDTAAAAARITGMPEMAKPVPAEPKAPPAEKPEKTAPAEASAKPAHAAAETGEETAPEETSAPGAVVEPVTASTTAARTVPLGQMAATTPPVEGRVELARDRYTVIAAADVPGFTAGQQITGMSQLREAVENRLEGLNHMTKGEALIASIRQEVPDERRIIGDGEAEWQKIERVTNEALLPGGSLVAAAGWCAEPETIYDLCPVTESLENLITLPSVTTRRGGLRWPKGIDFSSVYDASCYFEFTEEQMKDPKTEKPCCEIPCPEFDECTMGVIGLCVTASVLQQRGWPEVVEQFLTKALIAHRHKLNVKILKEMEAKATKVTPKMDTHGPGATESALSVLELLVTYYRYKYRLSNSATLEAVFPLFMRGILKSDLRKKLGIDNRWSVSDATLDTYLRNAGVNPQWVVGWQDSFADGATGFGGSVPTVWPTKVKVLLYPAGTFFQISADLLNIRGVRDSAQLKKNVYTALFFEQAICIGSRCNTPYVVELDLCANGMSGWGKEVSCATTPPSGGDTAALAGKK
ncbi:major capsid protein [Streptomyces alboflavus]|uniref:major capsid protein n=1 Tax=Streptomyces alboflavus TaxID=67267 RepID=UPI0036807988